MDTGTSWGEPISDAAGTSGWGNASLGQQASSKPGMCFCGFFEYWYMVAVKREMLIEGCVNPNTKMLAS